MSRSGGRVTAQEVRRSVRAVLLGALLGVVLATAAGSRPSAPGT